MSALSLETFEAKQHYDGRGIEFSLEELEDRVGPDGGNYKVCPVCKSEVFWLVRSKSGQKVCETCLDVMEGF